MEGPGTAFTPPGAPGSGEEQRRWCPQQLFLMKTPLPPEVQRWTCLDLPLILIWRSGPPGPPDLLLLLSELRLFLALPGGHRPSTDSRSGLSKLELCSSGLQEKVRMAPGAAWRPAESFSCPDELAAEVATASRSSSLRKPD